MCDEKTELDNDAFEARHGISRRAVGKAAAFGSLGIAAFSQPVAADGLVEQDVKVPTPDGEADAYFVHPSEGAHAGVLIWPDILGLRPAFRSMGARLASAGYAVLVVNPYYRTQAASVVGEGASFRDKATRDKVLPLARSLSAETNKTDAKAFVDYLDAQSAVDKGRKIGTTGYCMGGPIIMRTAAARPDRIGAAASFHGGGLVTERPDSPHLLIPQMKASFLIAVAENDDEKEPETKNVLRTEFAANGLAAEIEVYEGALHGWCPPDSRVYNEPQAERAWSRLLALFDKALA